MHSSHIRWSAAPNLGWQALIGASLAEFLLADLWRWVLTGTLDWYTCRHTRRGNRLNLLVFVCAEDISILSRSTIHDVVFRRLTLSRFAPGAQLGAGMP